MKALLLVNLLLLPVPVFAQMQPPPPTEAELKAQQLFKEAALVSPGTIAALDESNGFRQYKFGTSPALYSGLKGRGKGRFIAPEEPMNIGNVHLASLVFTTYNGLLSGVTFSTYGEASCVKLLALLEVQYGPGKDAGFNKKSWRGNTVSMFYGMEELINGYGVRSSTAFITMRNNSMLAEEAKKPQR